MLPPDISTLLIPIHYRIHVDQLKDLVEAPSVDEFLKLVTRTPYLRHTDTQTPASIETIYKETACTVSTWQTEEVTLIPSQP